MLASLKERATLVAETFNSIPGKHSPDVNTLHSNDETRLLGMRSNQVAGAMYAFPAIDIPPKAIEAAKAKGQQPDFFYAMELLETTGICIVPGKAIT